jgi:capsular polysaccharide biosynthesis protein
MRAKAEVLERQIAEVDGSLASMPNAYRRITMLDAQITSRSKLLEGLQIKSGEVRMAEMADARVSRLTLITEPEIDTVISEARKYALFGALAIFGLGLGLMIGVVVDRSDHRIHDVRVLSQTLEVPVLGSISISKK